MQHKKVWSTKHKTGEMIIRHARKLQCQFVHFLIGLSVNYKQRIHTRNWSHRIWHCLDLHLQCRLYAWPLVLCWFGSWRGEMIKKENICSLNNNIHWTLLKRGHKQFPQTPSTRVSAGIAGLKIGTLGCNLCVESKWHITFSISPSPAVLLLASMSPLSL